MVKKLLVIILCLGSGALALGQAPERVRAWFPGGTVFHQNIPYANDTLKKHLLDIYLPANAKAPLPLVVWIHGGAWMLNDKYADMGYMKRTVSGFIEAGYALASIDYRHSTTAPFPAQIQDCNAALEFLHNNASKYNIDKTRIVLIGFSAGGHLASLQGLALNNNVSDFYAGGRKPSYNIRGVIDFYGPSDFLAMIGRADPDSTSDPISRLLGASALRRPDLSKRASPVTYVDKNDPPFFIVQGEKDESVPYQQSVLLQSYLNLAGVKNELTVVKGAPHYGEMFDAQDIRDRMFKFLKEVFR
ncbi:alpha/beta hydrolase [Chryseolinea sp. T2]|uniref:alpha/beta hydrolase n=1 Tax=Chryseolinea sp. T2 TaxID=3129255 RepID=UPI003077E054